MIPVTTLQAVFTHPGTKTTCHGNLSTNDVGAAWRVRLQCNVRWQPTAVRTFGMLCCMLYQLFILVHAAGALTNDRLCPSMKGCFQGLIEVFLLQQGNHQDNFSLYEAKATSEVCFLHQNKNKKIVFFFIE